MFYFVPLCSSKVVGVRDMVSSAVRACAAGCR